MLKVNTLAEELQLSLEKAGEGETAGDVGGSADDWDGFETFHPETEVCAARVSEPLLEELQVVRLPASLRNLDDKGKVLKLQRPHQVKLPHILGGRDGCQVC